MANINDILNRDHRTTQHPLPRKVVNSNENSNKNILARCVCDNCLINSGTRKHLLIINSGFRKVLARKFINHYLILTVSLYIMSSNQAESSPIPATLTSDTSSGYDAVDKINFLNLHCEVSTDHKKIPKALSNNVALLRERLVAVLVSCHSALHQTKHLTDSYIKQLWGHETTVSGHHDTWEHKNIPWLWPENRPLPKKFRGDFHEIHLNELLKTEWTREKIFDYLGKIYQRFQRIGVGVQVVNKWNEIASMDGTTLLNTEQVNISTKLFRNATEGIHEVLCQIQSIFLDMAVNPKTDLDITPFVLDKFIKLNHWLVYREYEHLMDYSHKLLKIITEDKKP